MSQVPPSASPAQPAGATPTPVPKKTSPWLWVAVGCGALILIVVLLLALGGLWLFKKGKEFVGAAEKNPAVAAAKLAAAVNPDIEVVSSDDDAGTVTLRNRKTGETITLNAQEIKEGKLSFRTEKGDEVRIESQPGGSSFKVSSEKGELTVGEGGLLPSWVPVPEGVALAGVFKSQGEKGSEGGGSFKTHQLPEEVLRFYQDALKQAGFSPSVSKFEQDGKLVGGLIRGERPDGRKLTVTITTSDGKTSVALLFGEKR